MSDSHKQVQIDGNIVSDKTVLWSNKTEEKKRILTKVFTQDCWKISSIENVKGGHWKVIVNSPVKNYKLNLYISSIRDEDRADDEFKTQLGGINILPSENGWQSIVMGIYTINNKGDYSYILASVFDINKYNFPSNPSIRLARTKYLQNAQIYGFCQGDNSFVFKPEFLYFYLNNYLDFSSNNTESDTQKGDNLPYAASVSGYIDIVTALKTKPFLLLAGISGTGKSQKVQELAYMSCPEELRDDNSTTPGNYCLIEVKPNWHDSSEVLGYYSSLTGKYELTEFVRFVYKAIQNKNYPFFLCMDEMNLAPVEQYFAEYLSVLETRKLSENRNIVTQPLLSKNVFANCKVDVQGAVEKLGYTVDGETTEPQKIYSETDTQIISYLKENGLYLPDNLFVIGTVNMDDTTHQFSRKVIDRAFTIEMNGGKMAEMFNESNKTLLDYPKGDVVPLSCFKAKFVRSHEVLENSNYQKYRDIITTKIPSYLGESDGVSNTNSINGILARTPYRVSYRVQNELVLYLSILIEKTQFPEVEDVISLIHEAILAILLEKIMPRIQGEQKQLETQSGESNVIKDLLSFVENNFKPEASTEENDNFNSLYNAVVVKLKEMNDKLDNYYTNFF